MGELELSHLLPPFEVRRSLDQPPPSQSLIARPFVHALLQSTRSRDRSKDSAVTVRSSFELPKGQEKPLVF